MSSDRRRFEAAAPGGAPGDSKTWLRRALLLDYLTPTGWRVLAAGALALVLAWMLGRHELMALGCALLGITLLSLAALRFSGRSGEISRTLSHRTALTGRPFLVRLHAEGSGSYRDMLPEDFGVSASVRGGEELKYELTFRSRGVHRIGPLQRVQRDALGLVEGYADLGQLVDLPVLPDFPRLQLPPGHDERMIHGESVRSRNTTPDQYDVGIRDYFQGDSVRQVHWRATARHGKLMVRQEHYVAAAHAQFIVDLRSAAWHLGGDSTVRIPQGPRRCKTSSRRFEHALAFTLGLAELYGRQGHQIHVHALDAQALDRTPTQPGSPESTFEAFHAQCPYLGLDDSTPGSQADAITSNTLSLLERCCDEPVVLVLGDLNSTQAKMLLSVSRTVRRVDLHLIVAHPERYAHLDELFEGSTWNFHRVSPHSAAESPGVPG